MISHPVQCIRIQANILLLQALSPVANLAINHLPTRYVWQEGPASSPSMTSNMLVFQLTLTRDADCCSIARQCSSHRSCGRLHSIIDWAVTGQIRRVLRNSRLRLVCIVLYAFNWQARFMRPGATPLAGAKVISAKQAYRAKKAFGRPNPNIHFGVGSNGRARNWPRIHNQPEERAVVPYTVRARSEPGISNEESTRQRAGVTKCPYLVKCCTRNVMFLRGHGEAPTDPYATRRTGI